MGNTKLVNIRATTTVRSVTPPIYGTRTNVTMTTGDILNCLCRRATVEEVFPNGKFLRLNLANYHTVNDPNTGGPSCIVGEAHVEVLKRPSYAPPVKPVVVEEPVKEEEPVETSEPVMEEAPVVEEEPEQLEESVEEEESVEISEPVMEEAPVVEEEVKEAPKNSSKNKSKKK